MLKITMILIISLCSVCIPASYDLNSKEGLALINKTIQNAENAINKVDSLCIVVDSLKVIIKNNDSNQKKKLEHEYEF